MEIMPLSLKATISRAGHSAKAEGKVLKEQDEKKAILRFVRWEIEDGRVLRWGLLERSRISRVECKERISWGKLVRLSLDSFNFLVPR